MQVQAVRELARDRGIKPGKLNKLNLIRVIQVSEGNFDCFATAKSGYCDQQDCLWRDDCFSAARKLSSN
ncbi:MAG: SAP domain-containing protein [Gammaproteobacteria bacterium]|nr:MAG: SAP domain-containing protein [Gammaproteobacteria bacterium]